MKWLVAAIVMSGLCLSVSGAARAEAYALNCFGPTFGSAAAPVGIAVNTGKKQFRVAGEPYPDVAIDGSKVTAMKETNLFQIDLSSLQGTVLNDAGLSTIECKRK